MTTYTDKAIKAYKVKVFVEDDDGAEIAIGRAQTVRFSTKNNLEGVPELGNSKNVEIAEGLENVTGSLEEVMVNLDMAKNYAFRNSDGDLPYMKFIAYIPIRSESREQVVTITGAKLEGFDFNSSVRNKTITGTYNFQAIEARITG